MKHLSRLALPILCCTAVSAQTDAIPAASPLHQLAFLLGSWNAGAQTTELGKPEGVCTFTADLGGHTILRRNRVSYTGGSGAGPAHEDLLIVYVEDRSLRAVYFDS